MNKWININITPLVSSVEHFNEGRPNPVPDMPLQPPVCHDALSQYTHHIVENTLNNFTGTLMLYVHIQVSIKQKRGTCVTSEPSYNNYLITSACTDKVLTAIAVNTIGNRDKLN